MNLDNLTTDARIIIVITAAVLFGGLVTMTILGIRGAGRKRSFKTGPVSGRAARTGLLFLSDGRSALELAAKTGQV